MAISKVVEEVYSKYRAGKLKPKDAVGIIDKVIEGGDIDATYQLSRFIYARGDEDTKRELTKKLLTHGYKDMVPWSELKKLRQFPQ